MGSGWIKFSRDFLNHWSWTDRPFSYGHAVVDLYFLANFKDGKFSYMGKVVEGKRGCVYRSVVQLSDRWGWSRKKTTAFLKALENDGIIAAKIDAHGTVITIENYDDFQCEGTEKSAANGSEIVKPKALQKRTVEVIKERNDDNFSKRESEPPTQEEVKRYCAERGNKISAERFFRFYSERGWKTAAGNSFDWRQKVVDWEASEKKAGDETHGRRENKENREGVQLW